MPYAIDMARMKIDEDRVVDGTHGFGLRLDSTPPLQIYPGLGPVLGISLAVFD